MKRETAAHFTAHNGTSQAHTLSQAAISYKQEPHTRTHTLCFIEVRRQINAFVMMAIIDQVLAESEEVEVLFKRYHHQALCGRLTIISCNLVLPSFVSKNFVSTHLNQISK